MDKSKNSRNLMTTGIIIVVGCIMYFLSNTSMCRYKFEIFDYLYSNCNYENKDSYFCQKCNELRSQDSARLIVFHKELLCDSLNLLNPTFPTQDNDIFNDTISSNACSLLPTNPYLAGYYLEPEFSIGNLNNKMKFTPIWIGSNGNNTIQINGTQIIIGPDQISYNVGSQDTFVHTMPNPNRQFEHNILQFSNEIDTLDKTFISYYELKMILDNCTYLGISGAKVSSGNIATKEQNSLTLVNSGNKEFFTYRIIGFRTLNSLIPRIQGGLVLIRSDQANLYKPSSHLTISQLRVGQISIPTETWATPCPPMWYIEN